MSRKKVIYKQQNSQANDASDSDCTSACFKINADVELKDIPTNGEEYLLKVIKERQKYSFVTRCEKDFSQYERNVQCAADPVPVTLRPTIEWQNIQVADFSETRLYLSRMLLKKSLWQDKTLKINIDPDKEEKWKSIFENSDPTLSCLLGLHGTLIDYSLEILTDVLDNVKPGSTISHKTGQWIYALLACIRLPLMCDTTSTIRSLARKCAEIRSHLDPNDVNSNFSAAPLNIFICLISRYFGQYDLAD